MIPFLSRSASSSFSRARSLSHAVKKSSKSATRSRPLVSSRCMPTISHAQSSSFKIYFRPFHRSSHLLSSGQAPEAFLQQVAELAQQLTPEVVSTPNLLESNVSQQIALLKEALSVAKSQNSPDKLAIFVALVTTCDAHQRSEEVIEVVQKHKEWLFLDEVALKEIPGVYADALFGVGRKADALQVAAQTSEHLLSLPAARLETVVVALFNLGVLQQSCGLIEDSIRSMTRASLMASSSPSSSNTMATSSAASDRTDSNHVSDEVLASLNSFLGTALLRLSRKNDAIPYLTAAVDSRERLLKTNPQDDDLRNNFIHTIEALSAAHLELEDSENSRLTWERASLVLEYGGDTSGWLLSEVQSTKQEMDKTLVSPSQLAGVHHRHAKALIACNTLDSLQDSLTLLKNASDTYRSLDDKHALLDSLEDLANAYEALAHKMNGDCDLPSNAFVEEQIAVFGECLVLGQTLNGAYNQDNARYLCNLAIFTSARGETERARNLVKAALYICEKNDVDSEEEIYARAQTLMLMLTGSKTGDGSGDAAAAGGSNPSSRFRGDRVKTGKM